jgi:hypothetical protein
MSSLRQPSILRQGKLKASLSLLVIGLAFILSMISQPSVYAGGGIGSGGSGGSGSSGPGVPYSSKGWGWYNYSANDGVAPAGFNQGGPWSTVSQTCRNVGADRVIAFIVLKQSGTDASTGVVYDYHSSWDGWQGYKGGSGGDWLPTSTAEAKYNSITGVDKTGFTWGSDVAWFCYSSNPQWSLSASSTADRSTAIPGDTIHWTHTLRNDGPSATTTMIHSNLGITGFSNGRGGPGEWSAGNTGSGAGVGTIRNLTDYATYTVQENDLGNTLCEKVQYDPANSSGARDGRGNNSCVSVPRIWNLTVGSTIRGPDSNGNLTWTHTVHNNGPTTTSNITYHYQNRGDWSNTSGPDSNSSISNQQTVTFTSTYHIEDSDLDKNLCRATSANPVAWNNGSWTESSAACYHVPYNYTLTPGVSVDLSGVVETNASFSVTPLVTNSGPTASRNTQWQLTQIIVQPGSAIPNSAGGNSGNAPCGSFFQGLGASCSTVKSGSAVFDKNSRFQSGNQPSAYLTTAGDLTAGTRVCYAFSVQPRSSGDSQWAHSAPACLIIGKKPKVQFWGGDLLVGGLVNTSSSVKNVGGTNTTFGSWDEYGIFSLGTNTGMASGSAFAGSGLKNVNSACDYSSLSFTNAGNSSCTPSTTIGNYTLPSVLPNVASGFSSSGVAIGDTIVPNNLLAGPGLFIGTRAGDLTINASQLDPGKSVILKVSGTVTITGNQTYNNDNNGAKYTSILQLPQLVIIADRIIIKDTVSNIDAWLVAVGSNGILDTCSINASDAVSYTLSGDNRLTTNKCNTLLTVNGPVIAQHLWLRRTAGSEPGGASGDPGEIFNLRADAYLWADARATSSGRIQTVYTTELPPRF